MVPLNSRKVRLASNKFCVDLPIELSGLMHDPPIAPLGGEGDKPMSF